MKKQRESKHGRSAPPPRTPGAEEASELAEKGADSAVPSARSPQSERCRRRCRERRLQANSCATGGARNTARSAPLRQNPINAMIRATRKRMQNAVAA